MTAADPPDTAPARRRRPPPRLVEVVRTEALTPHFRRITFTGPALEGFHPGSPSSYVKLFLPADGEVEPALPTFGPDGPGFPEGAARPVVRTYTPRAYDAASNELDIDFVLHGAGWASTWAESARPGDRAGIAGPGPGYEPDPDTSWFMIAGDESALPAIATIVEALPAECTAHVIVEIPGDEDRIELTSSASLVTTWIPRRDRQPGAALEAEISERQLPAGSGRFWVAAEARVVRRIRTHLLEDRNVDRERLVVRGYWRAGDANHPDHDYGDD